MFLSREFTKGLSLLHRLASEGCYPIVLACVLSLLSLQELARAVLVYGLLYPGDSPLQSWLSGRTLGRMAKAVFDGTFFKHNYNPRFKNALRLDYGRAIHEYRGARFHDLVEEVRLTYGLQFAYDDEWENGQADTGHEGGLVDRLTYPRCGSPSGEPFEFTSLRYNPKYDFLVAVAKDYRSFTLAVFAFGKTKGPGPKLRYHYTDCRKQITWLTANWSDDGRYLLAMEYASRCDCRPLLFALEETGEVRQLVLPSYIPQSSGASGSVWCSNLSGFLWPGWDKSVYFIGVDRPTQAVTLTRLEGPRHVLRSIARGDSLTVMSVSSSPRSRVGWVTRCDEKHGRINCNAGHDNIHWTTFDRTRVYSDRDSCTFSASGKILDLVYDRPTERIVFCAVPMVGCRVGEEGGDRTTTCQIGDVVVGDLDCVHKRQVFKCTHKRTLGSSILYSWIDIHDDDKLMHIVEMCIVPPSLGAAAAAAAAGRPILNYNCHKVPLDDYEFSGYEKLLHQFPWTKLIITCVTDHLIVLDSKKHNCQITAIRGHKCCHIGPFFGGDAPAGPYIRHRSRPYFTKLKSWRPNTSVIDVRYFQPCSDYLLSDDLLPPDSSDALPSYTACTHLKITH